MNEELEINNNENEASPDPNLGWSELTEDDPNIEVIVEGVNDDFLPQTDLPDPTGLPLESLTREQLISRMQKDEEERRNQQTQSTINTQINSGFESLAQRLAGLTAPTSPSPPLQPTESEEQFQERIRELYHDDPVKAQDELTKRRLGPIFNNVAGNTTKMARQLLELTEGDTFRRFSSEVDKRLAVRPDWEKLNDADLVKKIYNEVKSENLSILIQEEAKKIAAEMVKNQGGSTKLLQSGTTPTPKPSIRQYSEPNYNPSPAGGARKVTLTLTADQRRQADTWGIPYKEFALSLKRRGVIK